MEPSQPQWTQCHPKVCIISSFGGNEIKWIWLCDLLTDLPTPEKAFNPWLTFWPSVDLLTRTQTGLSNSEWPSSLTSMLIPLTSADLFTPNSNSLEPFFLFRGIRGLASWVEFFVPLSYRAGFTPILLYRSTQHSPESFTHPKTDWAQDSWLQWSYENFLEPLLTFWSQTVFLLNSPSIIFWNICNTRPTFSQFSVSKSVKQRSSRS